MMQCTICNKELKTDLEAFGNVHAPLCLSCHFAVGFMVEMILENERRKNWERKLSELKTAVNEGWAGGWFAEYDSQLQYG